MSRLNQVKYGFLKNLSILQCVTHGFYSTFQNFIRVLNMDFSKLYQVFKTLISKLGFFKTSFRTQTWIFQDYISISQHGSFFFSRCNQGLKRTTQKEVRSNVDFIKNLSIHMDFFTVIFKTSSMFQTRIF